jgi:hypothetical protein
MPSGRRIRISPHRRLNQTFRETKMTDTALWGDIMSLQKAGVDFRIEKYGYGWWPQWTKIRRDDEIIHDEILPEAERRRRSLPVGTKFPVFNGITVDRISRSSRGARKSLRAFPLRSRPARSCTRRSS